MQEEWTERPSTITEDQQEEDDSKQQRPPLPKQIASFKDDLFAAEKVIRDHATTEALRAKIAEFQQRLGDLGTHTTGLESKTAAPHRQGKTSGKKAPASDNLGKLNVEATGCCHGANWEQARAKVTDLQRCHSTIEAEYPNPKPNSQAADQTQELETAFPKVARVQKVVEEQGRAIEEQEQGIQEHRELPLQALVWTEFESPLHEIRNGICKRAHRRSCSTVLNER